MVQQAREEDAPGDVLLPAFLPRAVQKDEFMPGPRYSQFVVSEESRPPVGVDEQVRFSIAAQVYEFDVESFLFA